MSKKRHKIRSKRWQNVNDDGAVKEDNAINRDNAINEMRSTRIIGQMYVWPMKTALVNSGKTIGLIKK